MSVEHAVIHVGTFMFLLQWRPLAFRCPKLLGLRETNSLFRYGC